LEWIRDVDFEEGILLATEKYNKSEPVNLGAGFFAKGGSVPGGEISIKSLVKVVAKLTSFKGKIIWDVAKPDG